MVSDIVAHWYLFVLYIMILAVAMGFLTFVIWCILYYAICGYNTFKFMWYKWIKRKCPHICFICKYKNICELKNPP